MIRLVMSESEDPVNLSYGSGRMRWRWVRYLPKLWLTLCMVLVLIPLSVIVCAFGEFDQEIWTFLLDYQLPLLIKNTLLLLMLAAVGVTFLGVSTAWLTAMYRFPLRGILFWAMMLPLTLPAYVLAFVQVGIFDYTGVISTYLRESYGFEQGFPDIRNIWGLAAVMVLTFYPYVYLLARNAFLSMGQQSLEIGASLGLSPRQAAVKIALPMAQPWILGGLMLVMMEVLADFGAVSIFGVQTFTTAIYQAWFGLYSVETAKQLASLLVIFVFALIFLEQQTRGRRKFATDKSQHTVIRPLQGAKAWFATAYCLLILALGFLLPIAQLLLWSIRQWRWEVVQSLFGPMWHSLAIGFVGAGITTLVALTLVAAKRSDKTLFARIATRIATLGYAIPGSILALGVAVSVAALDNWLIVQLQPGEEVTGIFKGTLLVMLTAYMIRFLALAVSSIDSGFERIQSSITESAITLGAVGRKLIMQIYLPLLKGSLGISLLMVFVDIMKEMPITLMTRPYDSDTLAVRIYAYTMEGQFVEASLPALFIVLSGLLPVILFAKAEYRS